MYKVVRPNISVNMYQHMRIRCSKLTNSQDQLQTCSVFDIPVRLLQSAGYICTSRITDFLESLLSPISINYCNTDVDEYCKDSRDYLLRLEEWKTQEPDQLDTGSIFVVAADVIGLYPNLSRNLVKSAEIGNAKLRASPKSGSPKFLIFNPLKLVRSKLRNR